MKKGKIVRTISTILLRIYSLLLLKQKVRYVEKLPKRNYIYAVNHPTTTDPFIIYSLFPKARVLIYNEIFEIKILGYLFRKLEHIPVDYNNGRKAYEDGKRELEKGNSIIIFPEGKQSRRYGNVSKFKTGVIRLSLETKTPIVPIGIKIEEEKIRYIKSQLSKEIATVTRWYFFGKYDIKIGRVINLRGNIKDREYVQRKALQLQREIQGLSKA